MPLSRQNAFTEDELESLHVWNTPGFFNTSESTNALKNPAHQSAPTLTVEAIENVQQQAYDEAFTQGKKEGYDKGYDSGYQEGLTKGHSEGLEQGQATAEKQQAQQAEKLTTLMTALDESLKNLDESIEQQLVSLAIAIARQLVRREIKQNPGEIMAVVRAAVAVLPIAVQKITLSLHPADAELVKTTLALSDTMTSWTIIEDPLMTQGGCKIATDVSLVDATVEKRLAAVIAMVLGDEREHESR